MGVGDGFKFGVGFVPGAIALILFFIFGVPILLAIIRWALVQ